MAIPPVSAASTPGEQGILRPISRTECLHQYIKGAWYNHKRNMKFRLLPYNLSPRARVQPQYDAATGTRRRGFTIVELLVVIVVIAILTAISVISYSAIQSKARDSARYQSMASLEKAIDLYYIDNGGYPDCQGGTYVPGTPSGNGCPVSDLESALVPAYINAVPSDPVDRGFDIFQYAPGRKKLSSSSYTNDWSNNYITGMRLETLEGNLNVGWAYPPHYNYLGGSSN